MQKHKTAVLIPCYNEAQTIAAVIKDYQKHLPDADIYVYDNNSSDGTDQIARDAGAIVRYEYRQGKGNVIRTMFREIQADCYLIVDGDDTYPACNAKDMVRLILEQRADMVIGDRLSATYFTENKRKFHNFGNVMVRKLVNSFFKSDIKDIMTGYRAFNKRFVKSFPVTSKGFEIETEMTIHALDTNLLIQTVPVDYRNRPEGSVSKLSTFSDGAKVLKTILKLYKNYRPMAFFGMCTLILLLCAVAFFIPVFITYLETGLVPRLPTLFVSGILGILGVLSLICGLILDTVIHKHKQLFEIQLNILEILDNKDDSN